MPPSMGTNWTRGSVVGVVVRFNRVDRRGENVWDGTDGAGVGGSTIGM